MKHRGAVLTAPLFALGVLLAGCGGSPALPSTPLPVLTNPVLTISDPEIVRIPDLQATSTLVPLHLDPDTHALQVPDVHTPLQAGWYADGVKPGAVGPAVIAAHVNGDHKPGLFAHLSELKVGALVYVDRVDKSTVTFRITHVNTYPKETFPTEQVYGNTTKPELRLITCGGEFDAQAHSYKSNTVAYAEEVA